MEATDQATAQIPPISNTETPRLAPVRARLVDRIFSLPAICICVVVMLIFGFCARRIVEPDIWWHLRDGLQILQYHSFPSVDTYSWGAAGSPRLAFEWLSEVLFFAAFKIGALRGILMLYFGLLVLIYCGVYYIACSAGADCISALLVTLLAVMLGAVSIGPRTLLFGWLCMTALLLVLHHFQRTRKGLWLLPPLFAVWINLHGSWVFGIVVLAGTIGSGLLTGEWGLVVARRWSSSELKTLVLVFAASVAALFVNPFGYKLVLYPFELLSRQTSMVQNVEEWQSVDFGKGSGKLALITVVALLMAALFSARRWRLDQVLLVLFALWVGLAHVRFLFFLGLVVTPILAPRLELWPPHDAKNRPWVNAAIMAAMVGWLIFSCPTQAQLQQDVDAKFPTAALEFMQRQHISGRVLNQDWWGGYMEWQTPTLKPFVDTRDDIFVYNGTLDDYVSLVRLRQPFELVDKYRIDYALLEPNQALVYVLSRSPMWHTIYSDSVAVLLARTTSPQHMATPLDRGPQSPTGMTNVK